MTKNHINVWSVTCGAYDQDDSRVGYDYFFQSSGALCGECLARIHTAALLRVEQAPSQTERAVAMMERLERSVVALTAALSSAEAKPPEARSYKCKRCGQLCYGADTCACVGANRG